MKNQLRRFLLAAALASGLCSSSLYQKTNAHDFPLRGVACPFADSLPNSSDTYCPMDDCEANDFKPSVDPVQSINLCSNSAFHSTGRQHVARAFSTLANWLNEWDRWQRQLALVESDVATNESDCRPDELFVALPDIGLPPAPQAKAVAELAVADSLPSQMTIDSTRNASTQSQALFARNPFAPGISEEYAPYDFDARDSHWLPGIGQAWDWNSSVHASLTKAIRSRLQQLAAAEFSSDAEIPLAIPVEVKERDLCKSESSCPQETGAAGFSAVASAHAVDLGRTIGQSLSKLDDFSCVCYSELCDLHNLEIAGHWLGAWVASASYSTADGWSDVASPSKENYPSSILPPLMYVLYTTTDGFAVVVPADMARAWNFENSSADVTQVEQELATSSVEPTSDNFVDQVSPLKEVDFRALRTRVLIEASEQLDWLGIRLLQAADKLSDWAEPQIAKNPSPAIR